MSVTVNNFRYFSTVRFMTSTGDTSVGCLATDCRLLRLTAIRVVHRDQATRWMSKKSWFDSGQGKVKASRLTTELIQPPITCVPGTMRPRSAADLSDHFLPKSRISADTHTLPQASMADTGTTITSSSNAAHFTRSNVLVQSRFHVGLYFEMKVSYWYMKSVLGGTAGAWLFVELYFKCWQRVFSGSLTLAFADMYCIRGNANLTASRNNVRMHAGISTLTVSQWTIFLNQTRSFAKIKCDTEMCTQQHTHAVEIPTYTEPKNQSPTLRGINNMALQIT